MNSNLDSFNYIDTARHSHGLASGSDKRAFIDCAKYFARIERASLDLLYPGKHDKVAAELKDLGLYPAPEQADKVFGQQLEAARRELANQIAGLGNARIETLKPRIQSLMLKLADRLDGFAVEVAQREEAEAAKFAVPYEASLTRRSIEGTVRDLRARAESGAFTVANGERPETLLAAWVDGKPLSID